MVGQEAALSGYLGLLTQGGILIGQDNSSLTRIFLCGDRQEAGMAFLIGLT